MFVVCQYKKKFVIGQTVSSGMGKRERQRERGGVELDHERQVRKWTGWKVHIESNPRKLVSWAVSAFSWTPIAKTKLSQHTCVLDSMWTLQPVRFRACLSWPHTPPLHLSHSHSWRSRLANDELCIVFSDIYSSGSPFRQIRPVRILRMCARSGFSPNLCPFNPCVERFLLSACACHGTGSSNNNCNSVTGACTCINNLLTGRTCDECPVRRRRATIPLPPLKKNEKHTLTLTQQLHQCVTGHTIVPVHPH